MCIAFSIWNWRWSVGLALWVLCENAALAERPHPPIDLGAENAHASISLPDGSLESFFRRSVGGNVSIFRIRSVDSGLNWSEPAAVLHLPVRPWGGPMPLLDLDGEIHFVIPCVRGAGRKPAVDRFIDLYHLRTRDGRTWWTEPKLVYEGYVGAIQGLFQLKSGRIIAPFADWLPGVPTQPPTGPSATTACYSDDGGATWRKSSARLTAPCYEGYNGGNYGACEPTLLELADGRVWLLIRTQTGFLYESFSESGAEWSDTRPSIFRSSNSPAFPVRRPDGRILVFWNNCLPPPRLGKDGVYGGRDALHAAISADEGKTWRGFREVYRDPARHETPPESGDRGTAYPHATVTAEGKVLLVSGQGVERRRRWRIDPDWLFEKEQAETFESLDAWHVFKGTGPAQRFWRDRTTGAQLIAHPDKLNAKALQVRRADELDPDGAVWNFPAGQRGRLHMRISFRPGFGGGQISLADCFFDPCDNQGEREAVFALKIDDAGRLENGEAITLGQWHDLELSWDCAAGQCLVKCDGRPVGSLTRKANRDSMVSYLRLRSTASKMDPEGFLVESVRVVVE